MALAFERQDLLHDVGECGAARGGVGGLAQGSEQRLERGTGGSGERTHGVSCLTRLRTLYAYSAEGEACQAARAEGCQGGDGGGERAPAPRPRPAPPPR